MTITSWVGEDLLVNGLPVLVADDDFIEHLHELGFAETIDVNVGAQCITNVKLVIAVTVGFLGVTVNVLVQGFLLTGTILTLTFYVFGQAQICEVGVLDLRDKDNPLEVCVCGSTLWNVKAMFEDGQISLYMLDMECALCGSLATAPTPIDDFQPYRYPRFPDNNYRGAPLFVKRGIT